MVHGIAATGNAQIWRKPTQVDWLWKPVESVLKNRLKKQCKNCRNMEVCKVNYLF